MIQPQAGSAGPPVHLSRSSIHLLCLGLLKLSLVPGVSLEGQREAPCTNGSGLGVGKGPGRGFLKEEARGLGLLGVGVCVCAQHICVYLCMFPCDLALLAVGCVYVVRDGGL